MTVVEAIGLAFSVVQAISPIGGASPSEETRKRIVAAYDLAVERLRANTEWDRIKPVDESFLARESNWQLIIESALGIRTLNPEDFDLSRFDAGDPDDPALARVFLDEFSHAVSRDAPISTLVTVKQTAATVERTLGRVPTRRELLDGLMLGSRHRVTRRLIAAGISPGHASVLALELPVHRSLPDDALAPGSTKVLAAPVGAGKSVLAELAFQEAVHAAGEEPAEAVVWLDSRTIANGSLFDQVGEQAIALGCRPPCPLTVIIDGLDELDFDLATRTLDDARALAATQNAAVLLTTRPLPLEMLPGEQIQVPPLSKAETLSLASLAADRDLRDWDVAKWPASIREAASLPLFALLTGAWLKAHPSVPATTSELVEHLISGALNRLGGKHDERERWLMVLASESTTRSGPVALRDLPHTGDLDQLAESGLIQVVAGQAEFVLALLREWFAAQAVLKGIVTVGAVVSSPEVLTRWKESLRALLGIASTDFIHGLLARAVGVDPGLIGDILESGAPRIARVTEPPGLPESIRAGTLVRESMMAFHQSLGTLADRVMPVDPPGEVSPVGALADGQILTIAWLRHTPSSQPVIALDRQDLRDGPRVPWTQMVTAAPSSSPAWPWVWAHEAIRDSLTELLKSGYPLAQDGPIADEAAWAIALKLLRTSPFEKVIKVDDVRGALGDLYQDLADDCHFVGFPTGLKEPLRFLRPYLDQLGEQGIDEIRAPWPQSDVWPSSQSGSAWVWDFFTTEQLRLRTEAVYAGALAAYEQMSRGVLAPLAHHLDRGRLFPVSLRFFLELGEGGWHGPTGTWHLVPLPLGSENQVIVDLVEEKPDWKTLSAEARSAAAERPDLSGVPVGTITGTVLDVFGKRPMTEICYQWLADDLARIHWAKEHTRVDLQ
ncbi:MAG: hypothetical protein D9V44_09380 [Actinobacteria bacterium]|nr:MAG: hypothetical protein D9V44_09380 [Actinomycetota bacterium]